MFAYLVLGTKVYLQTIFFSSLDAVKERLQMFQEQYNEVVRGAKMDLVFFRDAILHILRISRIIRTDRGCAVSWSRLYCSGLS